MTDPQSNNLDMFLAVNLFYLQNQALVDGVPARALGFGQLGTNITAINVNIGAQSATTKGVTQDKTILRSALNSIAFAILSPARAWALSVGNNTLAEQFHVSLSQLEFIKDDTIGAFCQMRLQLVADNLLAMADYGITQTLLDTWTNAIQDYNDALADPRGAIVTRKQKTSNLKVLFKQTTELFKNTLDPLMVPLQITDPEVYGLYLGARIVIDRKGKGTGTNGPKPPIKGVMIDGLVANAVDDTPITEAEVKVTYPGNAEGITTTTDSMGAFKVIIPLLNTTSEVTADVNVSHPLFISAFVPLLVAEGKAYIITVVMDPLTPPPPPPPEP